MPQDFFIFETDIQANFPEKDLSNDEIMTMVLFINNAFDVVALAGHRQLWEHDVMQTDMLAAGTWAVACVRDDGSSKVEQLHILWKGLASDDVVSGS